MGPATAGRVFEAIFARDRSYRLIATRANGQPAFGVYVRDPATGVFHANGMLVVTAGRRPDPGDDPLRQQRHRKVRPSPAAPLSGQCTTREGAEPDPDTVITLDVDTLNALLLEGLAPREAIASWRVSLTGDPGALDRFARLFAIRQPPQ